MAAQQHRRPSAADTPFSLYTARNLLAVRGSIGIDYVFAAFGAPVKRLAATGVGR